MDQISINFKRLREFLGHNQAGFAAILGITASHLSMIEAGKRSPSIDLVTRVCDMTKIKPNKLMETPNEG